MSLSQLLLDYNWRKPATAQPLKGYGSDIDEMIANLDAAPLVLLRLGCYLQHHLRRSDEAALVLDHVRSNPGDLSAEDIAWATNNLAYALMNGSSKLDMVTHQYADKLLIPLESHENVRIASFATRIKGQMHFNKAEMADNFSDSSKAISFGIALCVQGVEKLDPTDPDDLTEIARTYNNNAVKILKLNVRFPANVTKDNVEKGLAQAQHACTMWETYSKATEHAEYRGRSYRTLGELQLELYGLTQDKADIENARTNLEKAQGLLKDATDLDSVAMSLQVIEAVLGPRKS